MKRISHARMRTRAFFAICMIAVLSGCAGLPGDAHRLTGSVTYREKIALSSGEMLELRLLDVTAKNTAPKEIAALRQPAAMPPMVFVLPYEASRIIPDHAYVVEARIVSSGGDVLFRSDETYRVLTGGAPEDVNILVRRALTAQSDGARKTDGSDVARDVAEITARLPDLRVIPGQYVASDHTVTYKAFVTTDGVPLLVEEHRDLGKFGTSDVKLYYRNGQLLRFAEDAKRVGYGDARAGARTDAGADAPLHYRLTLDFAQGRFSSGTKTVNGVAGTPDEHEISGALAQSKVALSRIDAMLAQMTSKPAPLSGAQVFVCEDKSRFSVTFDSDGERAMIAFPGRDVIALSRMRSGSGYAYGNDMYLLRGKGQEAFWHGPKGRTHCAISVSPVMGLAIAPGDFPVVTVAGLARQDGDVWTRYFADMWPAINACLASSAGDLTAVLKAWPMNHGMVGVRTINSSGARHDCLVPQNGLGTAHTELVETTTNILPGEDVVRFTPASGAYPGGDCFVHQRLEKEGVFVGWLSKNIC